MHAGLRADGFIKVDRLVDETTVDALRAAYDDIIDKRVHAQGDRWLGGVIRQVMFPDADHATFQDNRALDAALDLAGELFGRPMAKTFCMLIDKPGGTVHETPWHQDVGYFRRPTAPKGTSTAIDNAQVWIALDPVTVDGGCMHFVPWAYGQPSLAHRVVSGDPEDEGRLIAVDEPLDTTGATAMPLDAGGCTVHLPGTPHYTGPNTTARPRRAYIINVGPS